MQEFAVKFLTGTAGAACFAVLYDLKGRKLVLAAAGGALGLTVYLVFSRLGFEVPLSLFFGSLAGGYAGEILARTEKTPVLSFLVPMLIPLVPGGNLYYTMYALLQRQYEEFGTLGRQVAGKGIAIAMGIVVSAYTVRLIMRVAAWEKKRGKL